MVKRLLSDSSEIIEASDEFLSTPDVSTAYKNGKIDLDQINRISALLSPRERLISLIKSTLYLEEQTHESNLIHSTMLYGLGTGITIGFIGKGKERHREFIRNYNQAAFENVYIAKRKYLDTYISQGVLQSAKYGAKVSLLGGACCFAIIIPMTIRDDEYRITDSTIGMGVVCGLSRLNLGMRAVAVGALIGLSLGALAGSIVKSYVTLSGQTPQEIRFWNHKHHKDKELQKIRRMEEKEEKELIATRSD